MYTVTTDDQSQQHVDALPAEALAPFAEARAALEGSGDSARQARRPATPANCFTIHWFMRTPSLAARRAITPCRLGVIRTTKRPERPRVREPADGMGRSFP